MNERYTNIKEEDLIYNIIFDIPKEGKIEVSRFVEGMKDCLVALEEINHAIVGSIDNTIQVISYIEALEAGSLIYKLKDKIRSQSIDIAVAATAAACGDYSAAVGLLLKNGKDLIISINNNKNIEDKNKDDEIYNSIAKELEESGINNELKGYLLDKKKLLTGVQNFRKGVQKTDGNVFWQKNDNQERIKIDNKLQDELGCERIVNNEKILSVQNVEEIYICLTPTSKENCLWEFEDGENKIQCKMEDEKFFREYVAGLKKFGGREKMQLQMKIEKFEIHGKIKKRYSILTVQEMLGNNDLFDTENN